MSKWLMTFVTVGSLLFGNYVYAEHHEHADEQGNMIAPEGDASANSEDVEVGNTICPVSGEMVGEMGPPEKIEYKGKIYNLCCSMCKKDFLKDPETFSKKAEEEVKKAE